jgi:hypothetical protein
MFDGPCIYRQCGREREITPCRTKSVAELGATETTLQLKKILQETRMEPFATKQRLFFVKIVSSESNIFLPLEI